MENDIPLKIEIFSSEEDAQHLITSAKEIEFVLHNIADKGARVALYYGDANDSIITTLLAVDKTGLWLEGSQNHAINRNIAESNKLVFVGSHYQVKVQFSAETVSMVTHQDQPALFIALPKSIHRLQRREYYRLLTPVTDSLRCVVSVGKILAKPPREVTIMDISAGGVGLTCTEDDTELTPGQTYHDCKIELPDVGTIIGTIEVRNLALMTTPSGQRIKRAGCEFKNLDGTSTILLQRYVTNMQRTKGKP